MIGLDAEIPMTESREDFYPEYLSDADFSALQVSVLKLQHR